MGDYASGTKHVLPTNGFARSYSGVNVESFLKKITYQQLTKEGLQNISETVMEMAAAEGLEAHKNKRFAKTLPLAVGVLRALTWCRGGHHLQSMVLLDSDASPGVENRNLDGQQRISLILLKSFFPTRSVDNVSIV